MNRKRVSAQLLLYFLMLMFLMVVVGCSSSSSSSDNAVTYSVSGTVTGASGVTVNLSGDATATTTTATDGTYSFTGLLAGNYSVTAVKTGFTFDPLSRGGTLTADKTGVDFAATANAGLTYSISGTVSGAVIAGVTILLTGDANAETVTGTDGKYSFPGVLLNGNYTVTPSLTGYTFSPAGTGVIISGADATGINFTATANTAATYSISGTVSGDTIAGVTITLSGGTSGTAITTTDGSGNYSFSGLLPGGYTVTPSKTGYTFTLASLSPTITSANIPGQNFTSSVVGGTFIYSISGTVSGAVTSGVTINLTGAATATATTGGGGTYSFPNLANGAYTVTPVLAGYTFSPSSRAVNIAGGNITGRDFTATANTAATYSISGTVSGDVKSGVTITLGGAGSGTTTTNGSGNYSFSGLVNGSYTLTPSLAGYTITPSSLSPTISSANVPGQNFVVGSAPTAFSQADLNATWDIQVLQTNGSVSSWSRQTVTINSLGTISFTSCLDSGGSTSCPTGTMVMTINSTTGVITMTQDGSPSNWHGSMTSNKNFIAATNTGGDESEMFIIQKKGGSYTAGDIQGKTLVYHMLRVGKDDSWEHGEGNTDGSGSFNLSWLEGFDGSSGSTTGTIAVNTSGIVTIIGDSTAQGFMSSDKKTVVLTMGDASHGYHLMIMQITATEFTAGALPAGTAYAHMLGIGATTGWIHETTTVAPGGGMTFSDWVTNNPMFTAPSTTYTGNITTTSGTLTITGNPTFHGQISHDQKIIVGTQTQGSNPNYVYLLNVVTK